MLCDFEKIIRNFPAVVTKLGKFSNSLLALGFLFAISSRKIVSSNIYPMLPNYARKSSQIYIERVI